MRTLRAVVALAVLAVGLTLAGASAHALTYSPCPTGKAGFGFSFWEPYDDPGVATIAQEYQYQKQVNDLGYVIDFAVDDSANAAWYPNHVGMSNFMSTIPDLLAAVPSTAAIWFGLAIDPNVKQTQNWTNWSYLENQLTVFERVADDLYAQYGSRIAGWYVPSEPDEVLLGNYNNAYQYGVWLGQVTGYLHTHDGNKGVMVAPLMPSAETYGFTASQFVDQMWPMMANAGFGPKDVWNMQDGFGMTDWSPATEAAAFSKVDSYAAQSGGGQVWSDVYTASPNHPAAFEPYLQALAPYINLESQWLFYQYQFPGNTSVNPSAVQDNADYRVYCNGR